MIKAPSTTLVQRLVRLLETAQDQGLCSLGPQTKASDLVDFAQREAPSIQALAGELAFSEHRVLDGREVAALLRVNERDLTRLVRDGMPCLTIPGARKPVRKYLWSEVLEWAKKRNQTT